MPLLVQKNMSELLATAMGRLAATPITETGPGGIARLLLAVINEELAADKGGFYQALSDAHAQAFLSTAEGQSLDLIGELLACSRDDAENDDKYRFRISKQTLSLAAANETAIRLAALSVDGVKDVLLKPFTHGTGSGSLYVVTDDPGQASQLISQVQTAVDAVAAYGVRIAVFSPTVVPVELHVRLIFTRQATELEQKLMRAQATQVLKDYVNSRRPGESLVINEITQRIMQISDLIFDLEVVSFAVAGRPVLVANQSVGWNERFVESSMPGAIVAA